MLLLHPAVAKVGENNMSVRTKFMIETINALKNNKLKTGQAASSVKTEHSIRMKKTLGTLNTRNIRASEPLRIGLEDIRNTDKKGKWWLVGASWRDLEVKYNDNTKAIPQKVQEADPSHDDMGDIGTSDLVQLANEQRMNTDIRRAIFISIVSATDYRDAYLRLIKLRLKRAQELEIPRVLVHCAGQEQSYNPYYTLIARQLCGDKRLKVSFQFSLWDLFRRMGGGMDEGDEEEVTRTNLEHGDELSSRKVLNLAKMFGTLIADNGLSLGVLKVGFRQRRLWNRPIAKDRRTSTLPTCSRKPKSFSNFSSSPLYFIPKSKPRLKETKEPSHKSFTDLKGCRKWHNRYDISLRRLSREQISLAEDRRSTQLGGAAKWLILP